MRWLCVFSLVVCFGSTPSLSAQERKTDLSQERIDALIGKLGSRNFAVREKAKAELEKIGSKALNALQKAVESDDLETSRRAKQMVAKIEAEVTAKDFLAAKTFFLNIENVTVKQAVRTLQQKSGYKIDLTNATEKALEKKITLKLGNTSFWQAFDKLCSEAGLVRQQTKVTNAPINRFPGFLPPNIRIQPIPRIKIPNIPKIQPAPIPKIRIPNRPKKQPAQIPGALQVQIPKPVPVPIPIQVQNGRLVFPTQSNQQNDPTIRLQPGKPADYPTHYAGSVRIRLVPPNLAPKHLTANAKDDEILLLFEVMGEPRLKEFGVEGKPTLAKAIDDQGQQLLLAPERANNQNNPIPQLGGRLIVWNGVNQSQQTNYTVLRLKRGDKQTKALKQLQGTLTVGALGKSKELFSIANVLKSAGKSVKNADGAEMRLESIQKRNDMYEVVVKLEKPRRNNLGGIIIRGGGNVQIQGQIIIGGNGRVQIIGNQRGKDLPALVDKNGKEFQFVGMTNQRTSIRNGHQSRTVTMQFRPQPGQGEPERLVLTGATRRTVSVPFTFRDVPVR